MDSLADQTLPTISFSEGNLEVGSSSWLSTSKDVVRALEEHGCFIANYTNFSSQLHHAIFEASKELSDLPTHVKMLNTSDTPSHGYLGHEPTILPLYEGLGIENAATQEGLRRFADQLWPFGNQSFRHGLMGGCIHFCESDRVHEFLDFYYSEAGQRSPAALKEYCGV